MKNKLQNLFMCKYKWWQSYFFNYIKKKSERYFSDPYDYYKFVSLEDAQKKKKSDILFVFGSGYSINNLTQEEIEHISKHNTLSFNWFVHQDFINIDYHLIREFADLDDVDDYAVKLTEYRECINKVWFNETIYLIQNDLGAVAGWDLLYRHIIPKNNKILQFKTKHRKLVLPDFTKKVNGFVHYGGTLSDCAYFGGLLGFKKIVFVGVDLFDRRYFWLDYNETRDSEKKRGADCSEQHNTSCLIMDLLNIWQNSFKMQGKSFYTFKEESLLSKILPVYNYENTI